MGNSPGYINDKLGTIKRFYSWAKEAGLINELPFRSLDIASTGRASGRLAHADGRARRVRTADVNLREPAPEVRVLTRSQIDALLRVTINPTHRAVIHLGLSAGLRAEELATFPADYVIDCTYRLEKPIETIPTGLIDAQHIACSVNRMDVLCVCPAPESEGTSQSGSLSQSQ